MDNPLLQLVALMLVLVLTFLVKASLDSLKKRHLDPITKVMMGGEKEPDIRQMVENLDAHVRAGAQSAAAAVQGVVQVRDDLHSARAEVRSEIAAVKSEMTAGVSTLRGEISAVEKKNAETVGQLTGRLDEHGAILQQLTATVQVHTDQIARVETVQSKRGSDHALHDAATQHLKSPKDGGGV
jgi:hypothetical protein